MKTAKELLESLTPSGPGTTINRNAFPINLKGPVRIALNGVLPLDPNRPLSKADRQAIQISAEDEFLRKNPDAELVRTVIDPKVDAELLDEIESLVKEAVRRGIERMDRHG